MVKKCFEDTSTVAPDSPPDTPPDSPQVSKTNTIQIFAKIGESGTDVISRQPAVDRIAGAKLSEIFKECDVQGSGSIKLSRLAEVCRGSTLVADFFNGLPPVGGVSVTDAISIEGDQRGDVEMSWLAFQEAYLTRPTEVPMFEGLLLVNKTGALRFFRLFQTRLEHYEDVESANSGSIGRPTISASEVRSIEVVDSAFRLHLHNETMNLSTPVSAAESFEPWKTALCSFARRDGSKRSHQAQASSRAGVSLRGPARPKSSDPCKTETHPASTSKPQMSRALSAGRAQTAKVKELEVQPESDDTAGCKPRFSKMMTASLSAMFEPSADFVHELGSSMLRDWIASHPDPPVYQGAIGMSMHGVMAVRLAVLFRDRMMVWDKPLDAVHGKRVNFSMQCSDLRNFSIAGSRGIVLRLSHKTISFYTLDDGAQDQWSQMLLSILDPQKAKSLYRPIVQYKEPYVEEDSSISKLPATPKKSLKMTATHSARLATVERRPKSVERRRSMVSAKSSSTSVVS